METRENALPIIKDNREFIPSKEKEKSEFINFDVMVDETIRHQCRSKDKSQISDKEIFRIDGCYFFYLYNKNGRITTFSLREISKDEFQARKLEYLNQHPNHNTTKKYGAWEKDDKEFFVGYYKKCHWKKGMPIEDCVFTSESVLKTVYDAVYTEIAMRKLYNEEIDKNSRYEYAKKCGALGVKYNISYVNALRIGPDKDKLLAFKDSYLKAIETVKKMSLSALRHYHILIFRCGRTRRKRGLTELNINFFDADVNLLDLKELEEAISQPLEKYHQYCIQEAISTACELDFETRNKLYQELLSSNRSQKRTLLENLGITTDAIDLNRFPFSILRRKLAASIGIDNEN